MEFIILLIAGVLLAILGLPIWVLVRSREDREAIEQIRYGRKQMELRVTALERELAELKSAVVSRPAEPAEKVVEPTAVLQMAGEPLPSSPSAPPPLPVELSPVVAFPQSASVPAEPNPPVTVGEIPLEPAPTPPAAEAVPERPEPPRFIPPIPPFPHPLPRPAFNLEQFIGVKLFAWLGGLALFFAAALGLKYSFEHDLIPPEVRAALGFLLGAGLVVGGAIMRRKQYAVTSQTLCATGVVILYAVTFACRAFYHFSFFGTVPTFLLMTLITATAFVLAVRLDGQVISVLGMLGGFLTPVMLSTGEDNPLGLFGYIALLDLGLLAVMQRKRWDYLAVLAAIGTVAMQVGWYWKFFAPEKIFIAQGVFLGFPLLFLGMYVWAKKRDWMNAYVTAAAALLALVALGLSFDLVPGGTLGALPGRTFTIVFGADLVLLAMVALRPQLRALESIGGGTLFLLLSIWTLGRMTGGLLYWGLGLYFAFAVLHTVFPIVLKKLRPNEMPAAGLWTQFVPAATLLLAMLPIVRELTVPWLFWGVVLAVDLLAVVMALVAGALLGLLAVLVFTVAATAAWLSQSTAQAVDLSESLVVIGGFALFFFAASAFVWRKLLPTSVARGIGLEESGSGAMSGLPFDVRPLIPALSAVLPFLLLMMVVAQFKPANPSAIFCVAETLVVLLFALAKVTRSDALLAVGLASVGLLQGAWLTTSLDRHHAAVPLGWFLDFYVVFSVLPFCAYQRKGESRQLPWAVAALAGPVQFALVYWLVRTAYPNSMMGLLPAAFAVPALLGLFRLVKTLPADAPNRLAPLAWFGGVALFFITLIFPIQFDKQWITLAWALEGAALCWLFHRVPHPGLRVVGLGLLFTAFVRLTLNPAVLDYHARAGTPILNWYLYTYATVTMSLFVAARLLAPPRNMVFGSSIPPLLQGLGTVLAFLLLNIEIADYFGTGTNLTFEFTGNFARDMTYTIAWALFAFGLLLIGIRRRAAFVRYASLGLLGVALLKLFLHDLANLNQLYRIGAFAAVAVIAIVASFLYQRFLAVGDVGGKPGAVE